MTRVITILLIILSVSSCKKDDEPEIYYDVTIEVSTPDNQVWINGTKEYNGSCCKAVTWKHKYKLLKGNKSIIKVGDLKYGVPTLTIYLADTVFYTETKLGPIN